MTEYSYQIDPRPAGLGGGWRLRLLENGEEVGGGVFPADQSKTLQDAAYEDAMAEATAWLISRYDDEEPTFLDDEGPSDVLPSRITLPHE